MFFQRPASSDFKVGMDVFRYFALVLEIASLLSRITRYSWLREFGMRRRKMALVKILKINFNIWLKES
ncbi:hypothetical protein IPC355_07060 [Pseudomonas aeruginosa]|nr:hypothetical protein IPC355_07060 [Pseudomonas aeruginosa]